MMNMIIENNFLNKTLRRVVDKGCKYKSSTSLALIFSIFGFGVSFADPATNALPDIDKIISGDVEVSSSSTTLNVNQTSSKAVIDWRSFDVGRDAKVYFNQPNSEASTLNRINGDASQIFGRIEAPGEVILVNPYGMYFSPSATVDVGALVASVNNLSVENYLSGNYVFDRDGATGAIVNDGTIKAAVGGYVALLAPEVRNRGVMLAQMGTVAMSSGDRVTFNFGPNSNLNSITASPSTIETLIENKNAVIAPGGLIVLSAHGVSEITRSVIKQDGLLDASDTELNFVNQGGRVLISGDSVNLSSDQVIDASINTNVALNSANQQAGVIDISATDVVTVAGAINASANKAGTVSIAAGESVGLNDATIRVEGDVNGGDISIKAINSASDASTTPTGVVLNGSTQLSVGSEQGEGGIIILQGDAISLNDTTSLVATGATGGGNVLVGGDWQGGASEDYRVFAEPDALYEATSVTMQANALIDASATQNGDGGTIVLWSDVFNPDSVTSVAGTLTAKGGSYSGDGGFIETSGAGLDIDGVSVSTIGTQGANGQWLIDPDHSWTDITSSQASTIVAGLMSNDVWVKSTSTLQINSPIISDGTTTLTLEAPGAYLSIRQDIQAGKLILLAADTLYTYNNAVTLTTNNLGDAGALILSANVGDGGGGFDLQQKLTIRTNGGNVYIGGSNRTGTGDTKVNNMTAMYIKKGIDIQTNGGSVNLRGVVTGSSANGSAIRFAGGTLIDTSSIERAGGNISIYGSTNSEAYALKFESTTVLDSGTGTISLEGHSNRLTANGSGSIIFEDMANVTHTLTSASNDAVNPAISLLGQGGELPVRLSNASLNATGTAGISVRALDLDHVTNDAGSGGVSGLRFYETVSITTNSGDISLYGETTSYGQGVQFWSDTTINSLTGNVLIEGHSNRETAGGSNAVLFEAGYAHTITSGSTDAEAISIVGYGGQISLGLNDLILNATGEGGGIKIEFKSEVLGEIEINSKWGIAIYGANEYLAKSGDIKLLTDDPNPLEDGTEFYISDGSSLLLGGKADSPSSSDIYLEFDSFTIPDDSIDIATNGTFTLMPRERHRTDLDTGADITYYMLDSLLTSVFNFNQNDHTLTGLQIGAEGVESATGVGYVTLSPVLDGNGDLVPLVVNGPVKLYAGHTLNITSSIDTSAANGEITLNSVFNANIGNAYSDLSISSGSGDISITALSPKFKLNNSYFSQLDTKGVLSIQPYGDGAFFNNSTRPFLIDAKVAGQTFIANAKTYDYDTKKDVNTSTAGLKILNFSDIGGLVIGKPGTANNLSLVIAGNAVIDGPISLYGDTVSVVGKLYSGAAAIFGSKNTATGDISINSTTGFTLKGDLSTRGELNITVPAGRELTLNSGGDIYAAISGEGSVTVDTTDTVGFTPSDVRLLSIEGDLTINGGQFTINNTRGTPIEAPDLDVVLVSGAQFNLTDGLWGADLTVNSVRGDGSVYLGNKGVHSIGAISGDTAITANSNQLLIGGNSSSEFSGVLSGSVEAVTKVGTGTLTLSGVNTFVPSLSVSSGTLIIASQDAMGGIKSAAVGSGAILKINDVSLDGAATVSLGGTLISSGTSSIAGALGFYGSVNVSDGGTLTVDGVVRNYNSQSAEKLGSGTLVLNNYLYLNQGTDIDVTAGTLTIHPDAVNTTMASVGSTTTMHLGAITIGSGATLELQDAKIYTSNWNDVSNYGKLTFNGGTLKVSGSSSLRGLVALDVDANIEVVEGADFTIGAEVQDDGRGFGIKKLGAGTLILANYHKNVFYNRMSYSGTTTIAEGTLQNAVAGMFYEGVDNSASIVVAAGATWDLNGFEQTVGSISGGGNIMLDDVTLTVGGDNTSFAFGGVISETGNLTKIGTGTLTLEGVNTYTGETLVSAGLLKIGGAGLLGNGDYTGALKLASGFEYASSADQVLSGVVSGVGDLNKTTSTSSTLTLAGANTYTGATNISTGVVVVSNDAPVQSTSGYYGAGSLRVESTSDSFADEFSNRGWNFANTLGALTIGKSTNTATISIDQAVNAAGPVTVFGGDIVLNENVTAGVDTNIALVTSNSLINNVGAGALNVSGLGQWYVYAPDGGPSLHTYNNLDSANQAVWGETYATLAPGSVGTNYAGNRYIFASDIATKVTITTADLSKEYGSAIELNNDISVYYQQPYTFTAEYNGDAVSGAYLDASGGGSAIATLDEAFTVMPIFSVVNSAVKAGVGSENITITNGTAKPNFIISYESGDEYGQLTVTPKALKVYGIKADDKFYDGNNTAVINLANVDYIGLVDGDDVGISVTGTFDTFHASEIQNVTLSSSYTGAAAANYTITDQPSTTATIAPKVLRVAQKQVYNSTKVYDGTTDVRDNFGATFYLYGLIDGDTSYSVQFDKDTAAYNSQDVLSADKINLNGLYLSALSSSNGSYRSDYALDTTTLAVSGKINPKGLTIRANNDAMFVGQTESSNYADVSYTGLIDTETADVLDGSLAITRSRRDTDSSSGTYALTPSGLTSSNYNITYLDGKFTIIPADTLLIKVADATTTYGESTAFNITSIQYLFGDEVVDMTSSASISNNTVRLTDGSTPINIALIPLDVTQSGSKNTPAGNYQIGTNYTLRGDSSFEGLEVTGALTVNPKPITIENITVESKQYDASTAATVSTSAATGWIQGDAIGLSVSGEFADKNFGIKTVELFSTYDGADAANYKITDQRTATATISKLPITISGISAANKTYDGGVSAEVNVEQATGWLVGDEFSVSATGSFANKNVGTAKTVNLVSSYEGADVINYTITSQDDTQADIIAKTLTVSGITASTKIYNAGIDAAIDLTNLNVTGLIEGDEFEVSITGEFTDKNVGTNKTVNLESLFSGADKDNYSITSQATTTADIEPKAITISGIVAKDKIYDAGTDAVIITDDASGWISGDNVTVSAEGSFSDKGIGTDKTVTLTSSYGGDDWQNYIITSQTTTSADITKKTITISGITIDEKVYDATTDASINLVNASGWIVGDKFVVSATGAFEDKHVGENKTVTLTSSYSGADVGNYTIVDQASATGSITPKEITISGIAVADKTYDGGFDASITPNSASGWIENDAITVVSTGVFTNKNVGTRTVNLTNIYGGADLANYIIIDQETTSAKITAAPLTVSGITAADKIYDGGVEATVDASNVSFDGLIDGDTLTISATGAFADQDVGTDKIVTLFSEYGGADVLNYAITDQSSATASITKKALTITAKDDAMFVGQTESTDYAGLVYEGFVGDDTADTNGVLGGTLLITRDSASTNAGEYNLTPSGITAANYEISFVNGKFTIVQADTLLVKVADLTTTYGDNFAYTITSAQYLGGDNVIVDLTPTITGNAVDVDGTNFTLSPLAAGTSSSGNTNAGSYKIGTLDFGGSSANFNTLTITGVHIISAKEITIAGITAANREYDATAVASVDTVSASGWIDGDNVTVSATGAFIDKTVADGKAVTLTSTYGGDDVSNYVIADQTDITANITAKTIQIAGITAENKIYDGTANATVVSTNASGWFAGDNFAVEASGTFADKTVDDGKQVTLSDFRYSGSDVSNYTIIDQAVATANITAKTLTVSGITASNKVYNADVDVTIDVSEIEFKGLISGDDVTLDSLSGVFSDKNVGAGKTVDLTSSFAGEDLGNYSINMQTTALANITPAELRISGITAADKDYDGTTDAVVDTTEATYTVLLGQDNVVVSATGVFANAEAGTDKTVILTSQYTGDDVGNYDIIDQTSTLADIIEADTTSGGTDSGTSGGTDSGTSGGTDNGMNDTENKSYNREPELPPVPGRPTGGGTDNGTSESGSTGDTAADKDVPAGNENRENDDGQFIPERGEEDVDSVTASEDMNDSTEKTDELPSENSNEKMNFLPAKPLNQINIEAGTRFSIKIPTGVIAHANANEQLKIVAILADGSPLPDWIKFNPETQTFEGEAPEGEGTTLAIIIIASDSNDNKMQVELNVAIN